MGLKPTPLTIWVSTLPTRSLKPPLPWHSYPRALGRSDLKTLTFVTATYNQPNLAHLHYFLSFKTIFFFNHKGSSCSTGTLFSCKLRHSFQDHYIIKQWISCKDNKYGQKEEIVTYLKETVFDWIWSKGMSEQLFKVSAIETKINIMINMVRCITSCQVGNILYWDKNIV